MNEVNIIRDVLLNILYKNNDNDVIIIIKK